MNTQSNNKDSKETSESISKKAIRLNWLIIFSLVINLSYAIYNLYLGITSLSIWFGLMFLYYLILGLMKLFSLIRKNKYSTDDKKQYQVMRIIGIVFFFLVIILSCSLTLTLKFSLYKSHTTIIMISIAAYTFYKVIIAIINLVKARKSQDITLYTIRNINIAEALVSLLNLQMTMYQSFNTEEENNILIMNIITSCVVGLLISFFGIRMIIVSVKHLKRL
jgi:hypothetical protein